MKKLVLIVALLAVTAYDTSFAMTQSPAKEIRIYASDSKEQEPLKVSSEIASASNTIKGMLADIGGDEIRLSNVDKETLKTVFDFAKNGNKLDLPKNPDQLIKLINAANYLDYPTLLDSTTHALANRAVSDKQLDVLPDSWLQQVAEPNVRKMIKDAYESLKGITLEQAIKNLQAKHKKTSLEDSLGVIDLSNQNIAGLGDNSKSFGQILNSSTPSRGVNGPRALNLSSNLLTEFPTKLFTHHIGYKLLNLSNNRITSIPDDAFSPGARSIEPLLESLDLSNNNLTKINPDIFSRDNLSQLQYLDLSNNPLTKENIDAIKKVNPRLNIKF